jgi:hypothetical protein
MAAPIRLRPDFDAARLRALAKHSRDPDQTRRLLALAVIYEGGSRTDAARLGAVGLQTVRDWVLRFNSEGPEGLLTGKAPGARSLLNLSSGKRWSAPSRKVQSLPFTAWCAGAWSIWFSGPGRSSGLRSPRRP